MALEFANLSGEIIETKRQLINGVDTGIIIGHIATWQEDVVPGVFGIPDRVVKGAYIESLQTHRARKMRKIRMKLEHARLIGGFPIETAKEDNKGLLATGHINLDTQLGIETYSFANQGVLVDMSVGHKVIQDRIEGNERLILKADIWEGSITEEPKNRPSQIIEVKNLAFSDLPIASKDHEWNEDQARERVMELKFADGNGADAFIGTHLIADVVDGKLLAIPTAVRIAAEEVKNQENKTEQAAIEQYLGKMKLESPFETKRFYTLGDVQEWTNVDFKSALEDTGIFSNGAVRALIARSKDRAAVPESDQEAMASLFESIQATRSNI